MMFSVLLDKQIAYLIKSKINVFLTSVNNSVSNSVNKP
jgi:hypothetical protein